MNTLSFSQEGDWVKTEGEITQITEHRGKKMRVSAFVKFNLEGGTEQFGTAELFRIPFFGRTKSVGDKITINYNKNNPAILKTVIGRLVSSYGMYILIFLGIILSIKPFLKKNKKINIRSLNSLFTSYFLLLLLSFTSYAQVGINTTNPKGVLDITTANNTGLVLPRVSSIEEVTDGNGNPPVDGTTVYDISRSSTCFYQDSNWICISLDGSGNPVLTDETISFNNSSTIDYIKSTDTDEYDFFGLSVALSGDGNTLIVSKNGEDSNATGINGDQTNNLAVESGAVYVFIRISGVWSQQAYIKASNTEAFDYFAWNVALSGDGNTLAVSAYNESSNAIGINGNQTDNSSASSGAVYIFIRSGTTWTQEAYIKASNTDDDDGFGGSLALSANGNTLVVGALGEDSNATGINGNQTDNSEFASGAAYVFTRIGNTWNQQAYIKSSNSHNNDQFASSLALSSDGNTLAVVSFNESSNATGINGNQNSNSVPGSGAVYVFIRTGTVWTQQAYIKASSTDFMDQFGWSVAISSDGNTLAVGANGEDSTATGINGNQTNDSATDSGAAYLFIRSGTTWTQEAYIKASNTEISDTFGTCVALSGDGNTLAISALGEDSNATGINGDQANNLIADSGGSYIYKRLGTTWTQEAYIKASNTGIDPWGSPLGEYFGYSMALSDDGKTFAVGAAFEDSESTGINGNQTNDFASDSGVVYVYKAN